MATVANPPPSAPPTPRFYPWLIMVLGIVLLLLVLYRSTEDSGPVPPPPSDRLQRLSVIPPFSLTERGGRQITNRDLYGKVWVADFVYTTCPGPCPLVTAEMARVQDLIKDDPHAQLVTFTVDPENDTPGVLAAYADKYHALPDKWWFLTGPQQPMYDLIQNGFLQAVQNNGNATPEPGQYKVTHSTYFALVDAQGNMRQVYDSQSGGSERPDLLRDIKILEKEAGL